MSKYVLTFSKSGLIRFTSHLDMLRLFKRGFRRAGIELKYSQGFNPHPRMGFAQPLSLGYLAEAELLEFETTREYTKDEIISSMKPTLAQGIAIHGVGIAEGKKSLAALVDSATYTVTFPVSVFRKDFRQVTADYLAQKEDKTTREFISYLKQEPLLKAILAGHLHITVEEQFSPTARQYVVAGNFLLHGREVLFV